MEADLPGRHDELPHITVVVSGITPDLPKPDEEGGGQVAEQGGVVLHKDVVSLFSRRVVALENRMVRIEREMWSLRSNLNGRLTRVEEKLNALLKGQEVILSKMEALDRACPSTVESPNTHTVRIDDRLTLQQKRERMRAEKRACTSSLVTRIRRGRYKRPVKSAPQSKSSFLKHYRWMRAKQAAPAEPSPATINGSIAHEPSLGDIGSSSGTTPSEPQ